MNATNPPLQKHELARINVVGTSGSGKSTFAAALAAKLGFPVIEIDALFWEPNWTQPSDEVFFPKLKAALEPPRWVLILWTLKTYSKVQQRYEQRMQEDKYQHVRFVRLKNPREAQEFLKSLPI